MPDVPAPPPAGHGASPPAEGPQPSRAPGAYLRIALWQRFALAFFVAVVLLVAMIVFVSGHNTNSPALTNFAGNTRANREAAQLIIQDEAPHVVTVTVVSIPAAALERVLSGVVQKRVNEGSIDGPVHDARCRSAGPRTGPRQAFTCTVGAGDIKYPFVGVVDRTRRQVTYCKSDPPPVYGETIPFDRRCLPS